MADNNIGRGNTKPAIISLAVGIVFVVAFVIVGTAYVDNNNNDANDNGRDTSSAAKIIISGPIDAIDSEASFHPPSIRVLLGTNNTITWVNMNNTPVVLESAEGPFSAVIPPKETFSFTFAKQGVYGYYVKEEAGKPGAIIVSTPEMEENRLVPVSLSKKGSSGSSDDIYREIATTIATAASPQDEVTEMRLNNTRMAAYATKAGADIMVPKSMCHTCIQAERYDAIEYRTETGKPVLPQSQFKPEAAMNFSRQFMEKIGYEMDGTEWADAVNFGNRIEITFHQRIDGWIIPNHLVSFNYYQDHVWITVGKWYNDISEYKFGLSQDDVRPIAKEFMDSGVVQSPVLQKYGYREGSADSARVEIFDDKVVYVVPVGYNATEPQYVDDRDHCGRPSHNTFEVMVDASSGGGLGWRYALCE